MYVHVYTADGQPLSKRRKMNGKVATLLQIHSDKYHIAGKF